MKNFIEVLYEGQPMLINVRCISVVKAKGDKTLIRTLEQVDNQPKVYTVNESYPEIRRLIEDALR